MLVGQFELCGPEPFEYDEIFAPQFVSDDSGECHRFSDNHDVDIGAWPFDENVAYIASHQIAGNVFAVGKFPDTEKNIRNVTFCELLHTVWYCLRITQSNNAALPVISSVMRSATITALRPSLELTAAGLPFCTVSMKCSSSSRRAFILGTSGVM